MNEHTIFYVNEEPYCLWETSLKEKNTEYLNSIDPKYFEYLANVNNDQLQGDDRKRAAMAIRSAYNQGVETLFLLIGAFLQGHDCVFAWMEKAMPTDLRGILKKINNGEVLPYCRIKIGDTPLNSWNSIAEAIYHSVIADKKKVDLIIESNAWIWKELSFEYLKDSNIKENNSIKHGLRAKSGGFGLMIGMEKKYSVPPPKKDFVSLGHSEFGSSFFALKAIAKNVNAKKDRSYRAVRHSLNWRPESLAAQLELISMSIANIVTMLKVLNGADREQFQLEVVQSADEYKRPWEESRSVGVSNFVLDEGIDMSLVKSFTRADLIKAIKKKHKKTI